MAISIPDQVVVESLSSINWLEVAGWPHPAVVVVRGPLSAVHLDVESMTARLYRVSRGREVEIPGSVASDGQPLMLMPFPAVAAVGRPWVARIGSLTERGYAMRMSRVVSIEHLRYE